MACQTGNLNISAPLLLSNAVARGYRGPLRIAHISSGATRTAFAGWSVYGATKAAADADADARLRISSIAPGVVNTEMQATIRRTEAPDFPLLDRFLGLKQEGNLASPEDAARQMPRFMLSDDFGKAAVVDLRELPTDRSNPQAHSRPGRAEQKKRDPKVPKGA